MESLPHGVRSEEVELGALLTPDSDANFPGIVLIHDVWGLADHTRDMSARLAAEGFAVLAVDLYRRHGARGMVQIEAPGPWIQDLSDPQVGADLESAARFLSGHPSVEGRPVGVVGFCMGGMYALLVACNADCFAASVPFYGILSHRHGLLYREGGLDPAKKPNEPLAIAAQLRCPLLGFFGDEDALIPLADVDALRAGFAAARPSAEVIVVEGAGHAFMNDTREETFRPEAAALAWARMLEFLRQELVR